MAGDMAMWMFCPPTNPYIRHSLSIPLNQPEERAEEEGREKKETYQMPVGWLIYKQPGGGRSLNKRVQIAAEHLARRAIPHDNSSAWSVRAGFYQHHHLFTARIEVGRQVTY